jgi:SAM-dependent methyltransferase
MGLREAWDAEAQAWIAWVRRPGNDSYDKFHRDQFLALVPPPGRLTVDLGCGEGRVARDLAARGHTVIGFDGSPALVEAARTFVPPVDAKVADAAELPLAAASADLVVAFMLLHDVDDLDGVAREIARVLEPGGRLCLAVVHPINSCGRFDDDAADAPFRIDPPARFASRPASWPHCPTTSCAPSPRRLRRLPGPRPRRTACRATPTPPRSSRGATSIWWS